jgi:hypothetical protein
VTIRKRNAWDFLKFLAQNNCISTYIEIQYMKTNSTDIMECVTRVVYKVLVSRRTKREKCAHGALPFLVTKEIQS